MLLGLIFVVIIIMLIVRKGKLSGNKGKLSPYDALVERYINKEIEDEEFIRMKKTIKNK